MCYPVGLIISTGVVDFTDTILVLVASYRKAKPQSITLETMYDFSVTVISIVAPSDILLSLTNLYEMVQSCVPQ